MSRMRAASLMFPPHNWSTWAMCRCSASARLCAASQSSAGEALAGRNAPHSRMAQQAKAQEAARGTARLQGAGWSNAGTAWTVRGLWGLAEFHAMMGCAESRLTTRGFLAQYDGVELTGAMGSRPVRGSCSAACAVMAESREAGRAVNRRPFRLGGPRASRRNRLSL
jgi:hypothetical protein